MAPNDKNTTAQAAPIKSNVSVKAEAVPEAKNKTANVQANVTASAQKP